MVGAKRGRVSSSRLLALSIEWTRREEKKEPEILLGFEAELKF